MIFFHYMVTGRVQSQTMVAIIVLFGLGILTSTVITRRADGQAAVDYEKINRQLEQAMKALDSGNIATAVKYLEETAQGLPAGEAKTHVCSHRWFTLC